MNFCSPDMQDVSSRYKRFFPYINRIPLKQDRNMTLRYKSLRVNKLHVPIMITLNDYA